MPHSLSPRQILIISHSTDLHADIIERKLQQCRSDVFRLNLDEFPRDYRVVFNNGSQKHSYLHHLPSGQELLTDHVGAVWLRKYAPFTFLSADLSPQEQAFAQEETEHLMYGLLFSLQCYWLSHPLALRHSQWKGEQLQRAEHMGFRVPRSLITNDLQALYEFQRSIDNDLIFKPMSSPALAAQAVAPEQREYDSLPTTRIPAEVFKTNTWDEELASVRELPGLFQEHIVKQHELRVTVVGEQVFAAKIHSQDDPRTATDYRDFSADIRYEQVELPEELTQRCIQFVRSYGLEFGAMDLIVTPDTDTFEDKIVFLENNPGGQFYFVEQLVPELRICDAVADLLIRHTQQPATSRVQVYG